MTHLVALTWPALVLSLASLGIGMLCLAPTLLRARHPLWLHASIAFVLGQGVLGTAFEFIALAGRFTSAVVMCVVSVAALVALVMLVLEHRSWRRELAHGWHAWREAPLVWKAVALSAVGFFIYGFSSIGGWLIIDAPAFYMAIAKMVGGTGRLVPLPGYDALSSVGLITELHMAALYAMGQTGTDPRILPWVSFPPTMGLFYGLARICGLTRRAALLTLVMVVSSTAVVALLGSGKTELLALGPAVATCVLVLTWWDEPSDPTPLAIGGLLTGFACVIKLGYLVGFLPVVAVLTLWRTVAMEGGGRWPAPWRPVRSSSLRAAAFLSAGFAVAFAPHLLKNWLLFDSAFAPVDIDSPWFIRRTTTRLLLTYPFALTYGRYWGQIGTISPLVLAYAPLAVFYGPKASHWTRNRVFAVSSAAAAGMAAWVILCPSLLAPRYFLATPMLFALPAAAAADILSRRNALHPLLVALLILVVGAATPRQANNFIYVDGFRTSLSRIMGPQGPCSGSAPYDTLCAAAESINARAAHGDRVLILSFVRLWLRPDLLLAAGKSREVDRFSACHAAGCNPSEYWTIFRTQGRFRFILQDKTTWGVPPGLFDSPPPDMHVRRLFSTPTIDAYEVAFEPQP
jgi:hypothetical protein